MHRYQNDLVAPSRTTFAGPSSAKQETETAHSHKPLQLSCLRY
jgi:hypothetical protein